MADHPGSHIGTSKVATIDAPVKQWIEMNRRWNIIDDILGGTDVLRNKNKNYLPKEDAEPAKSYENRLNRSFFYNVFKDTVKKAVSKPYSRRIQLVNGESLPSPLVDFDKNVDYAGSTLSAFGREALKAAVEKGHTHIFVDFPTVEMQEGQRISLAQQSELGLRPAWVHIKPQDLFFWDSIVMSNGERRLTEIRFKQTVTQRVGFAIVEVEQIRVYTETTFSLWQRPTKNKDYVKIVERPFTFGRIPLVTLYTNQTGFMTSTPPLWDLAWLNLEHWQKSSDQSHIIHISSVPSLFLAGVANGNKAIVLGVSQSHSAEDPNAKMSWVEVTGKAAEQGRKEIDKIEQRMEVLGAEAFRERTKDSTAAGKKIDSKNNTAIIFEWIHNEEMALDQAYDLTAEWEGVLDKMPKDFATDIYDDFEIFERTTEEVKEIREGTIAGLLPKTVYPAELKRRKILRESTDLGKLQEELENEQAQDVESIMRARAKIEAENNPEPQPENELDPSAVA